MRLLWEHEAPFAFFIRFAATFPVTIAAPATLIFAAGAPEIDLVSVFEEFMIQHRGANQGCVVVELFSEELHLVVAQPRELIRFTPCFELLLIVRSFEDIFYEEEFLKG